MMMNDWGMNWGWGGMWFGPVFMIGLFVLCIVVIVALYRWLSNDGGSARAILRTPREILDERFAKGEIERDEYEARRKALTTS